jgi:hypothetical protein
MAIVGSFIWGEKVVVTTVTGSYIGNLEAMGAISICLKQARQVRIDATENDTLFTEWGARLEEITLKWIEVYCAPEAT